MRTEGVERGVKRARFYAPPPDNYTLLVLLEQVERGKSVYLLLFIWNKDYALVKSVKLRVIGFLASGIKKIT